MLDPFLVVINADLAFRRSRRQSYPLGDEYSKLVDPAISLVETIYFQPIIADIERKKETTRLRFAQDADGNVEMGSVDEFGAKAGDEKDKITQKNVLRSSRIVKRPGPGAINTWVKVQPLAFFHSWSYARILSDQDLTPEDEDLLVELDPAQQSTGST